MKGRVEGQKGIEYYMQLPYSILLHEVEDDGERYWIAEVPELPGCKSHGSSVEEAVKSVEEARKDWILDSLEEGKEVPVPVERGRHSGKILVRMSRSLHRSLSLMAEAEKLSLNQLIVTMLAQEVGQFNALSRVEQKLGDTLDKINDVMEQRRESYDAWQPFVVGTAPGDQVQAAVDVSAFLRGVVGTASAIDEVGPCLLLQPPGLRRIVFSSIKAEGKEEEVKAEHK